MAVYIAMFTDDEGYDTVIDIRITENGKIPLASVDKNALRTMRRLAQEMANRYGKTVSIICFTNRQLYESYPPSATGGQS